VTLATWRLRLLVYRFAFDRRVSEAADATSVGPTLLAHPTPVRHPTPPRRSSPSCCDEFRSEFQVRGRRCALCHRREEAITAKPER
jgi:hypothetical protein